MENLVYLSASALSPRVLAGSSSDQEEAIGDLKVKEKAPEGGISVRDCLD